MERLENCLSGKPIIAAVHSIKDAFDASNSQVNAVFILGGDITEIREMVSILKEKNKTVFVHLDLVDGLNKDPHAVKFLADYVKPHGILTTKGQLIRTIKEIGLMAGQRCFILDSQSYGVAVKSVKTNKPDFVELMPAVIPKVVKKFSEDADVIIIGGGLVESALDADQAIRAGALGVSSSKKDMWSL